METLTLPQARQNEPLYAEYNLAESRTAPQKTSFLVYRHNKYISVPVENIAFFYVKFETSRIMCLDRQEFFVNRSLDHIQKLLPDSQFFRVNRQYLVNFQAIRDVEHYFARKLLVNPTITVQEKLIVPKEKVTDFLSWLDNR